MLKVPSLDTWKAVLREGPDWTDETQEGSPYLSAWSTHPRGSSTQERDRGRRDQAEVLQARPPQDHADSTQGNNPRRDEGLRSDLPLYHNGEMDEAEPDMEEIESRTTGLVQEANQVRQEGHVIPAINPHPPLCPFRVVEEQTHSLNIKSFECNPVVMKFFRLDVLQ
jgi:hypothetical protein